MAIDLKTLALETNPAATAEAYMRDTVTDTLKRVVITNFLSKNDFVSKFTPQGILFSPGDYSNELAFIRTDLISQTDNELFTVPAGKKALHLGSNHNIFNTTGANIASSQKLKRLGIITRFTNNLTTLANNFGQTSTVFCFEAGDIFIINPASSGLKYSQTLFLFPNNVPIATSLITLDTTKKVLYQCPPGKRSYLINLSVPTSTSAGTIFITNDSGVSIAVNVYLVPNGGIADAGTLANICSVGNGSGNIASGWLIMQEGESIILESNSAIAGQSAYATVIEETL